MTVDLSSLWINTWSGAAVAPFEPQPETIYAEDIAHALSHINRYTGHGEFSYSVAEHSIHVMQLVTHMGGSRSDAAWGLMHDATEAYLGDVASPIKRHPGMGFYKEAEDRLMTVIAGKFGLTGAKIPPIVKQADVYMLHYESEVLLPRKKRQWNIPKPPANLPAPFIAGLPAEDAKRSFLSYMMTFFDLGAAT